jgi:hypothetical protein
MKINTPSEVCADFMSLPGYLDGPLVSSQSESQKVA